MDSLLKAVWGGQSYRLRETGLDMQSPIQLTADRYDRYPYHVITVAKPRDQYCNMGQYIMKDRIVIIIAG